MSDVNTAIQFVLRQEDAAMSGITTNTANDLGGRTRWGIAEHAHPELTHTGFFDTMSKDQSLLVAEGVYAKSYAGPIRLADILSQQVANAALSFLVNEGAAANRVLQQAVNMYRQGMKSPAPDITVDGNIGSGTIAAINALPTNGLLAALRMCQKQHYADIVASNPSQVKFINGWNNRADADTNGQMTSA